MEVLSYEMWFEIPGGLQYKVTVQVRNGTNAELLEMARINWDGNKQAGMTPKSVRP